MSAFEMVLMGCDGSRWDISGPNGGRQGVIIPEAGIQGIYDAPVKTEWDAAAREVGGRYRGLDREYRDVQLGLQVFGDDSPLGWDGLDSALRQAFCYELDPFDDDAVLTRLYVRSPRDRRKLSLAMSEEPEFKPDMDPMLDTEGDANIIYKLRAGMPNWEGQKRVTVFESSATSASDFIEVSNPTDQLMLQTWVLTLAKWTIPDVQWKGAPGQRVPGGPDANRTIALKSIDPAHMGARINYDPMRLMIESWSGTNLLGDIGGNDFFMYAIPPYTPPTLLPISYTNAPSGGARAELHQPRYWSRPWGLWKAGCTK